MYIHACVFIYILVEYGVSAGARQSFARWRSRIFLGNLPGRLHCLGQAFCTLSIFPPLFVLFFVSHDFSFISSSRISRATRQMKSSHNSWSVLDPTLFSVSLKIPGVIFIRLQNCIIFTCRVMRNFSRSLQSSLKKIRNLRLRAGQCRYTQTPRPFITPPYRP